MWLLSKNTESELVEMIDECLLAQGKKKMIQCSPFLQSTVSPDKRDCRFLCYERSLQHCCLHPNKAQRIPLNAFQQELRTLSNLGSCLSRSCVQHSNVGLVLDFLHPGRWPLLRSWALSRRPPSRPQSSQLPLRLPPCCSRCEG